MTAEVLDPNEVFVPTGMDSPAAFDIRSRCRAPVRVRGRMIPAGRHEALNLTEAQCQELSALMSRHGAVISQTKLDPGSLSKVGSRLQLVLSQLLMGTFQAAYQWGAAWVRASSPSGEFIMPGIPSDLGQVIECLDSALCRLEALIPDGYPYPPMRAGRRQKVSLVDFIVTTPPNSGAYSPFIALLWKQDRALPPAEQLEASRSKVPSKVRDIASRILELVRGREPARWGSRQELMFWAGVRETYQWWAARAGDLIAVSDTARLVFGSGSALMLRIEDYARDRGFVPFGFICPTSQSWGDFIGWLARARGVRVPRRLMK